MVQVDWDDVSYRHSFQSVDGVGEVRHDLRSGNNELTCPFRNRGERAGGEGFERR